MLTIQARRIIMFVFLFLSVALFVLGMIILPDTLITQIGNTSHTNSTMPKMLALAIPGAICILFSVLFFRNGKSKDLALSIFGIVLFGFAFFVNL